jgi:uncharacterized protein (TIGR00251 family)
VLYEVTVEFNKEIFQISKNRITIAIKSKPINGKANKEIIKKIANHFEVPSSHVQIKSGHKSTIKIIEIQY